MHPETEAALARKRSAATMLLTDPAGRVLLVKPTYKPGWELPGGAIEADESPAAAGARELAEELGLCRGPTALLALDYVATDEHSSEGLIVVFDAGVLHSEEPLTLAVDELSDARFVALDELPAWLSARKARRVAAALAARSKGRTVYLEDGHPCLPR